MVTRLLHDGREIGKVGEPDNDPRHPRVGAIIDGPNNTCWEIVEIQNKGAVAVVKPFEF